MPSKVTTAIPTALEIPTATTMPSATTVPTQEVIPTDLPVSPPAAMPDPSGTVWTSVVTGLFRPVDLVPIKDGSSRNLVLEQVGVILLMGDDAIHPVPFLDIRDRVGSAGNEQGLLGIALDPEYSTNGQFFLNYTDYNGDTIISRFSSIAGENLVGDPSSEVVLLTVDQPRANHNGGQLAFGPDGYLYIGLGDGGGQGDPNGYSQSTNSLLGKILRIDVKSGDPYAIPEGNPFFSGGGLPEIFAIGLRNPWRFTFDRATGDLYIADVGQNVWEEIDFFPAEYTGPVMNYGWNIREGSNDYVGGNVSGLTDPIFEYDHSWGCSVTGGVVYRGSAMPAFQGVYIFGDYCTGIIWGLIPTDDGWQSEVLYRTGMNIASFGEDEGGEIYLLDLNGGIYRLQED